MTRTASGLLTTQTIRVNNLRVRYCCAGEGEPLVLLHAFPETLHAWRDNFPELARHYQVHAFDWPGLGGSDRPEPWHYSYRGFASFLSDTLDALGIRRASLVAADISAPAALIFAIEQPERVERLVVSGGPVFYRPGLLSWELRALQHHGPAEVMMYGLPRTMLRRVMRRGFFGRYDLPEAVYADYKNPFNDLAVRQAVVQLFRTEREDLEWLAHNVRRLTAPLLIIWGEKDVFTDHLLGQELRRAVPHSHLEIVERAGHFVHEEAFEEYNRLVIEFMEEARFLAAHQAHKG